MAGGSLAERRDAHQHGDAHKKPGRAGHSSSADRLTTAPHVHVIHTRFALDRALQLAAATVLLEEGVESARRVMGRPYRAGDSSADDHGGHPQLTILNPVGGAGGIHWS
jgi:hypothetical protein